MDDGHHRWCKTCQDFVEYVEVPRADQHVADYRCPRCNRHCGFVGNRDKPSRSRPKRHRELVAKFSRGFCEMCCRTKEQVLPGFLNAHHVVAFVDGGTSDRENIWIVCDNCHGMIHAVRRYVATKLEPELVNSFDDV